MGISTFKDTDKTVFVERDAERKISGIWRNQQTKDQEEMLESDTEVIAFVGREIPKALSLQGLTDALVTAGVLTQQQIEAAKK